MEKCVLFLINGLGLEKQDSCDVYNADVMPNFNYMMNKAFFSNLNAPFYGLKDGFKYFSISTTEPLEKPYIENIILNEMFNQNPKFDSLHKEVFNCTGNIHLFCYLNDEKLLSSLRSFAEALDPERLKKFYVHFILPQKSDKEFFTISKLFEKFQYEMPKNMERGMVVGKNILEKDDKTNDLNEYARILYNGVGERWKDVDNKLNALYGVHAKPCDTKAFYITDGYTISNDDLFIVYNYKNYDFSKFVNVVKNPPLYINVQQPITDLKLYSLFPLTNTPDSINLYDNLVSDISISKAMTQIGANALILTEKENINTVNFMANGLSNESNSHVKYVLTDNGILYLKEQMTALINDPSYQLIIINHSIDKCTSKEELQAELKKIDNNLAMVIDICEDKMPLLVSSLYGIRKEITVGDNKKDLVNFNGRVPVILIDKRLSYRKYMLSSGDTYSLFSTCLKFIKPDAKVSTLLKSKSILDSVFKK